MDPKARRRIVAGVDMNGTVGRQVLRAAVDEAWWSSPTPRLVRGLPHPADPAGKSRPERRMNAAGGARAGPDRPTPLDRIEKGQNQ